MAKSTIDARDANKPDLRYSRKGRYVPRNDSERQPARHIFVDVESISTRTDESPKVRMQSLRLWCCSSIVRYKGRTIKRSVSSGTSPESFWHYVYGQCKEGKPIWIWSHKASVDMVWLKINEQLDNKSLLYRGGCWEDSPFFLFLRYVRTNIRIIDSVNWFKCKLSELGKLVNLDKLDYPGEHADDETLRIYCMRDVEILEKSIVSLLDFVKINRLGMFRPTLPQQSFAYFRHLDIKPRVVLPEDQRIKELERDCYYGGRCECGFIGHIVSLEGDRKTYQDKQGRPANTIYGESVHYLDFQSHYPSVMRDNDYPYRFVGNYDGITTNELKAALSWGLVCAKVLINSQRTVYPYRDKMGTVYANGNFWTSLCTPEIELALSRGEIEKVGQVQLYEGAKLFKEPMENLWNIRKECENAGNKIYAKICKLLMNSMYGKWGQRGGGWRDTPNIPAMLQWGQYWQIDSESGNMMLRRGIAGNTQTKFPSGETAMSFPAISAHVTSYARVKLLTTIEECPQKSVYYWDTDSIHCNEYAYNILKSKGLVENGVLGKLRLVRCVDHAEYINAKCYVHDDVWTVSGLPGNSVEESKWILKGEVWERIGTILQSGPQGYIKTSEMITELSGIYERRQVRSDGWTFPLWIDQRSERQDPCNLESASQ